MPLPTTTATHSIPTIPNTQIPRPTAVCLPKTKKGAPLLYRNKIHKYYLQIYIVEYICVFPVWVPLWPPVGRFVRPSVWWSYVLNTRSDKKYSILYSISAYFLFFEYP